MDHENDLIKTYHVLILGALKKCHVGPFHPNFEDHLQTARWLVIDTYRYFIKEEKSLDSFNNYVYQRIFWKITDDIRKELHYHEKLYTEENDTEHDISILDTIPDTSQEDLLEIKDLFTRLKQVLTDNERKYLVDAYINELTMTQIATKHRVSRKTVHQWRNRVALKSMTFFDK